MCRCIQILESCCGFGISDRLLHLIKSFSLQCPITSKDEYTFWVTIFNSDLDISTVSQPGRSSCPRGQADQQRTPYRMDKVSSQEAGFPYSLSYCWPWPRRKWTAWDWHRGYRKSWMISPQFSKCFEWFKNLVWQQSFWQSSRLPWWLKESERQKSKVHVSNLTRVESQDFEQLRSYGSISSLLEA